MCDDLAMVAAVYGAAKAARVKPGLCWGLVGLLERSTEPPEIPALAILLGETPGVITRVITALGGWRVIDAEGKLEPRWRPSVPSEATIMPTAHALAQRRYRARRAASRVITRDHGDHLDHRGDEAGSRASNYKDVDRSRVITAEPPLLEEGENVELSSSLSKKAYASAHEHPPKFVKKQRWAQNTLREAQQRGKVTTEQVGFLQREILGMSPDPDMPNWGLSRRANNDLDKLHSILRTERSRRIAEPSLLFPINGRASPPKHPNAPPLRAAG